MTDQILLVDDETNVVRALQRILGKSYRVEVACHPAEALETIRLNQFGVVVSDFKMPGMNGIEFLKTVKEIAPEAVRILFTGHADLDAAIAAVNEGNIFRFLTKPATTPLLTKTLDAALEQHRLIAAEREVLHETLMGTVKVLVEILARIHPVAFGRTARIQLYVQRLARELRVKDMWQVEAAAALSQLGCISVPDAILRKYCSGEELSADEAGQVYSHPREGGKLLHNIPRLHAVAEIIERQFQPYEGASAFPPGRYEIALGAQLLRVAHDFDRYIRCGLTWEQAVESMALEGAKYNPEVLAALGRMDPVPGGSHAANCAA